MNYLLPLLIILLAFNGFDCDSNRAVHFGSNEKYELKEEDIPNGKLLFYK